MTILIIVAIISVFINIAVFVNPEGYRNFLRKHPLADHTGKWKNASDTKIRIVSAIVILYVIAVIGAWIYAVNFTDIVKF